MQSLNGGVNGRRHGDIDNEREPVKSRTWKAIRKPGLSLWFEHKRECHGRSVVTFTVAAVVEQRAQDESYEGFVNG